MNNTQLSRANKRLRNYSKFNLKSHYAQNAMVSLLLALGVITMLFRIPFFNNNELSFELVDQETITMEEVLQTEQKEIPPPPPRPIVPIEVPNDELLEDDALNLDAMLDLDAPVALPPPPPPPVEEKEEEPEIFLIVEQYPELISIDKIRYPEIARRAGVEGRVVVRVVVNEEGMPTNPEIMVSKNDLLNKEALRVIMTTRFKPGMQRGRAVKVQISLPINFTLN